MVKKNKINVMLIVMLLFLAYNGHSQNIHNNIPTYKCKVFTYDTTLQKITFKRDYGYWIYDLSMVIVKKGYGRSTEVTNLKKQNYYLFVKGISTEEKPSEAEVKKYAYIIKR
jgi:hypothetical protein